MAAMKPMMPPPDMGKNPQSAAAEMRRASMNRGKLPGLSKLPKNMKGMKKG